MDLETRKAQYRARRQRYQDTNAYSFITHEPMDGPPSLTDVIDIDCPRLRECPFDLNTIDLRRSSSLGTGLDGHVWKVYFGDQGPFALKLFWDLTWGPHFGFAARTEATNAASLQIIEAAVKDAASGSGPPILINPDPKTKEDAMINMGAFSEDIRRIPVPADDPRTLTVSSMPRMRQCFGWTMLDSSVVRDWGKYPHLQVKIYNEKEREIERDTQEGETHFAIVYEYVKEAKNDDAKVKEAADFLWRVGFAHVPTSLRRNWKDSVLVDLSDVEHYNNSHWSEKRYHPRPIDEILED